MDAWAFGWMSLAIVTFVIGYVGGSALKHIVEAASGGKGDDEGGFH